MQGSFAKRLSDGGLSIGFILASEIFKLTLLFGLNLSPQTFDSRTDDTRQNRREAFCEAIEKR
jgi:hypothetical protein